MHQIPEPELSPQAFFLQRSPPRNNVDQQPGGSAGQAPEPQIQAPELQTWSPEGSGYS